MTPKSVCLIHPPHPDSSDDCLDPPLGLAYIAASIRNALPGVGIKIVDLSGVQECEWSIPISDIYGITVYSHAVKIVARLIAQCRKINAAARVVVGGAHPSAVPETFRGLADHVVVGEGEQAMIDIIQGNESFVVTAGQIHDLFPLPALDLVDVRRYGRTVAGQKSLPMLSSRGCPYLCAFCGLAQAHKSGVRFQDPDQFILQMRHYIDHYGIRAFGIQDDIFTMSKTRLKYMLGQMKKLQVRFRCHGRAGLDTEDTYAMLADAGCSQVAWGIESGSQKMLDKMNKAVQVQDNHDVIRWAKKYGIDSRAFFVLGFPGETAETLEETRRFIEAADPDQYFVSNFVPYPGTDVWNDPEKYGVIHIDTDFTQYYQVNRSGMGGLTIDTQWLSRAEFRNLEIEFRDWMRTRKMRGHILAYEAKA